ncbi:RteC domain-containing protein [Niabella sp.]|uniref:RteC domain-containing protein n=1 Tax=Niabella sp. TaxID=1962976 RepID=UPI002620FAF5|nr:RteC domain-containing protein [Niabella sp.]
MITETLKLLEEMNNKLSDLSGLSEDDLLSIQQAIIITSESIARLKSLLASSSFESPAAEIRFFKKLKPQFDGRLIFLLMLLRMQTPDSTSDRNSIYTKELERLKPFYRKHYAFWQYYKIGLSHFDEQYFTRQSSEEPLFLDEEQILLDSQTNAPMSSIVARFYAYDLLKDRARQTIIQPQATSGKAGKSISLSWTSAKAELIELIYALHEYRAFNSGQLDVKKIADYFSSVFNIRFSNIYKTYEDIRLRKKNSTPFIDALKACLERRIDRDNENAM